jgi:hypothetical protein
MRYYADLFKDFDYPTFKAKLTEASGLLEEAGRLDPTNVEVLLNKIETLGFLAANAPIREWPSIYESIAHLAATVIAYRRAPRDDVETFQLAQATYYQAFARLNLYRQSQDRAVLLPPVPTSSECNPSRRCPVLSPIRGRGDSSPTADGR